MITIRVWQIAVAPLAAVLLGAAWYLFAPGALGGGTTYASTDGSSMRPTLVAGDLAILRSRNTYRVGEVVGYRSAQLHQLVVHRIAAVHGERYTFQGDNNRWIDPESVPRTALVGTLWVAVPRMGALVTWIHVPVHAVLLTVLGALLTLLGGGRRLHRRRRRPVPRPGVSEPVETLPDAVLRRVHALDPANTESHTARRASLAAFAALVGLAAVATIVAGISFSRPSHRLVSLAGAYTHTGTFSYSARVPVGPVYGRGVTTTGSAVFLRLARAVRFGFDYSFRSSEPHAVGGTGAVAATISDGAGWSRTFPIGRRVTFDGDHARLRGTLDLARLQRLVAGFATATGTTTDTFRLSVVPRIDVHGTVDDTTIAERFAPPLQFDLDAARLRLDTSVGPDPKPATSLDPSLQGRATRVEPNRVLGLNVRLARALALLAAAGAAAGALALRRSLAGDAQDEPGRIRARHGHLLVDAAVHRPAAGQTVALVRDMDSLARLATELERPILHEVDGAEHAYSVDDAGVVYRYETKSPRAAAASAARAATA